MDVALALGGGGAKGVAHLGVLRGLQEMGFEIKAVAGTSAGGMAAAIFANGFSPDQMIEKFSQVNQDELYSFGLGPALLGMGGISKALNLFLTEEKFEDLQIPCALTAVDIKDMREVTLTEGRVLDAVMATIAIPGIFPPKEWDGHMLVDGGVLDPVPVQVARSLAPGLPVIAVTLSPIPEKWKELKQMDSIIERPILKPIANLRVAQAFDIFVRSIDVMTHMLAEKRLELEKPAVIIRPDVAHIAPLDKVDVIEVARLGDQAVAESSKDLRKLLNSEKSFWEVLTGKGKH
mgnify:FL=1